MAEEKFSAEKLIELASILREIVGEASREAIRPALAEALEPIHQEIKALRADIASRDSVLEAAEELVEGLDLVFRVDWEFTQAAIADEHSFGPGGTFFDPRVEDEGNNWANRVRALDAYRDLQAEIRRVRRGR